MLISPVGCFARHCCERDQKNRALFLNKHAIATSGGRPSQWPKNHFMNAFPIPLWFLRRFAAAALVLVTTMTKADVTLPALFSNNMVLQAHTQAPIWGWASPGESVSVTVGSETLSTTAGSDGKWMVKFTDLAPSTGTTVKVQGNNAIIITNVLIGEVWLCSGQSNMAYTTADAEQKGDVNLPEIRVFTVANSASPQPQDQCTGSWVICTGTAYRSFSGTGFFFAKTLHPALNKPVGLIVSAWGGQPIEKFASVEAQRQLPEKATAPDGTIFNGMIHPLIPYGIRGAIWYQGEANATTLENAILYNRQLPNMIADWRARWGQGDFPFGVVQLPKYENVDFRGWREMRESQLKVLRVPNTGVVVTADIAVSAVSQIHPNIKSQIGPRLSSWAEATVYGKAIPYSGPVLDTQQIVGNQIICSFTHATGLGASSAPLRGFTIAGADRVWYPATGTISGSTVIVSSESVAQPVAVRYSWENVPTGNLVGSGSLPASPFRTDELAWPNAVPTLTSVPVATLDPEDTSSILLTASASDDGPLSQMYFTWSLLSGPSGGATASFAKNHTRNSSSSSVSARVNEPGTYVFRVTVSDLYGDQNSADISIEMPSVPASIETEPTYGAIAPNGSLSFSGRVCNQFGQTLSNQPALTWTVTGAGTITSDGTYSASASEGLTSIHVSGAGVNETRVVAVTTKSIFNWVGGQSGNSILEPTNWSPAGFANTASQFGAISTGSAVASVTPVNAQLMVVGRQGVGGALVAAGNPTAVPGTVILAGGKIIRSFPSTSSSITLASNLNVPAGMIAELSNQDSGTLQLSGTLLGTGTLRITGTKYISAINQAGLMSFGGTLDVAGGSFQHAHSIGALKSYPDTARLVLRDNGVMRVENGSLVAKMRGGFWLSGGRYYDDGNEGSTWDADTPWHISSDSVVETFGPSSYVLVQGPLNGNGTLRVRHSGTSLTPLSLNGTTSNFQGRVVVETTGLLNLGSSGVFSRQGSPLASMDILTTPTAGGKVNVGAIYTLASGTTDRPNTQVVVQNLTIGGTVVRAGIYNVSNRAELSGAVLFNNASSSLQVMEPVLRRLTLAPELGGGLVLNGAGQYVEDGRNAELDVTEDLGYMLLNVSVNGVRKGSVTQLRLEAIREDVFIQASFAADSNGNRIPDDWEIASFSALLADTQTDHDGDGFNALQEYHAGTSPLDRASRPDLSLLQMEPGTFNLSFPSRQDRFYSLERSLDMLTWEQLQQEVLGTGEEIEFMDSGTGNSKAFYRLKIRP
jgi:sialate O-acetylesterase